MSFTGALHVAFDNKMPRTGRFLYTSNDVVDECRLRSGWPALAVVSLGGHAIARIIPDNIEIARRAFQEANIRFEESEVHTVLLRSYERAGSA